MTVSLRRGFTAIAAFRMGFVAITCDPGSGLHGVFSFFHDGIASLQATVQYRHPHFPRGLRKMADIVIFA